MIRLIKPYIKFEEVKEPFREVFESGMLTKGKNVEAFRKHLASYTGADYAFLTTSATTALSTALKMYEIRNGDEVIISDFSFPATANVVEDLGATPVFADVDPETFNMRPDELLNKISEKTKAVIYVDALGNPSGILEICRICRDNDIPLIEDAACAIGSGENGIMCGNIADITCFSFHPRKLLTTGEGGAITTNSTGLAKRLEVKLNHGAVFNEDKGLEFIDCGYNYRMSELQAIMGMIQLEKLNSIVARRHSIRDEYVNYLSGIGFKPQKILSNVTYNVQSLVFVVPEGVERNSLIAKLKSDGVETTLGTYCLSNTKYYNRKYGVENDVAKFLENKTITFPCYDGVNMKKIFHAISKVIN